MNKPMTVGVYVVVAMLSGFGLWQAGSAAGSYGSAVHAVVSSGITKDDLVFLRQAKLQNDQAVAKQQAAAAAKAAKPADPVVP